MHGGASLLTSTCSGLAILILKQTFQGLGNTERRSPCAGKIHSVWTNAQRAIGPHDEERYTTAPAQIGLQAGEATHTTNGVLRLHGRKQRLLGEVDFAARGDPDGVKLAVFVLIEIDLVLACIASVIITVSSRNCIAPLDRSM